MGTSDANLMLRFPPAGPLARLCPGHYAVCARDVAWARRKYGSGGGTTTPSVTIQSQHFATLQIVCSAAKSASGSCTSANPDEMMHIRLFASEPACNYPRLLSLHFLQKKVSQFWEQTDFRHRRRCSASNARAKCRKPGGKAAQ